MKSVGSNFWGRNWRNKWTTQNHILLGDNYLSNTSCSIKSYSIIKKENKDWPSWRNLRWGKGSPKLQPVKQQEAQHMTLTEAQKNIYFCCIDYAKAFDCVDHNILWKILKQMGIPDHLTCLLRNLYAGQEETLRAGHETTDWFQIGKGVRQGYILSPCLFNLYAIVYHEKCWAGGSTS